MAVAPIPNQLLHASAAMLAGVALGGIVYGVSFLFQRRMMTEVQALVPKS